MSVLQYLLKAAIRIFDPSASTRPYPLGPVTVLTGQMIRRKADTMRVWGLAFRDFGDCDRAQAALSDLLSDPGVLAFPMGHDPDGTPVLRLHHPIGEIAAVLIRRGFAEPGREWKSWEVPVEMPQPQQLMPRQFLQKE